MKILMGGGGLQVRTTEGCWGGMEEEDCVESLECEMLYLFPIAMAIKRKVASA